MEENKLREKAVEVAILTETVMNKIKDIAVAGETVEDDLTLLSALAVMVGTHPLMSDSNVRKGILNIIENAATTDYSKLENEGDKE